MAQLFHSSTNTIVRIIAIFAAVSLAGLGWVWWELQHSEFLTRVNEFRDQPVMFSHKHHVNGLGLDCRYCHTSVEKSSSAGIPPTHTCMSCHSQIWTEAPILEPVRESYRNSRPLEWLRIHDLPDFAYFNHSIHIKKGIGCTTCHGQVDQMPLMRQANPMFMSWCLECHRAPEKFIRPRDEVFNSEWRLPADQLEMGQTLVQEYKVKPNDNCSTCHR